jgi:hypothetical protein
MASAALLRLLERYSDPPLPERAPPVAAPPAPPEPPPAKQVLGLPPGTPCPRCGRYGLAWAHPNRPGGIYAWACAACIPAPEIAGVLWCDTSHAREAV